MLNVLLLSLSICLCFISMFASFYHSFDLSGRTICLVEDSYSGSPPLCSCMALKCHGGGECFSHKFLPIFDIYIPVLKYRWMSGCVMFFCSKYSGSDVRVCVCA